MLHAVPILCPNEGKIRTANLKDPDRFLIKHGSSYHYNRRIPLAVASILNAGTHVRKSLKTDDLAVARQGRDALEAADNEYWSSHILDSEWVPIEVPPFTSVPT